MNDFKWMTFAAVGSTVIVCVTVIICVIILK